MESPPNPPRAAGIYEIRNVANCKVYVGSARLLAGRRQTHWRELKHGKHWNQALQADWCQFGESSFVFEVLEEVKELDLLEEREQFWINQKQSNDTDKGYNLQKVAVRAGGRKQECYVNLSKRSSGQWWIRFRLPPSMLTRRVVSDESCSGFSKPDVH